MMKRKLPYLSLLLSMTLMACKPGDEKIMDILEENCHCSDVKLVVSESPGGKDLDYTLYGATVWGREEAQRLMNIVQQEYSGTCGYNRIDIQFWPLNINDLDIHSFHKCQLQQPLNNTFTIPYHGENKDQ